VIEIRQLNTAAGREYVEALADVLLDCVEGGASVSFMASLTKRDAERFFDEVTDGVARRDRILLAALEDSKLVGTVQIVFATPPNQPHRADIAKLLVRRSARGRGIGTLLMQHAEQSSRAAGKTLLVLDSVTGGDGEKLYMRMGWTRVGVIPNYALFPDGTLCDTTYFYKELT
jgi:GNAT superfamily N-acetyltransferase